MPLCRRGLDGCVLHRGAKRLSSSPSKIRFPSLQNASLSITGHISSELLISMKRRFHFHWRKPFLLRHRPAGGPWPGYRQYSCRVALLSYSSLLHTVWSLLANNGSIISRIVTKRDLLGQRIIKLFSLFLFLSPFPPPPLTPQVPLPASSKFRHIS